MLTPDLNSTSLDSPEPSTAVFLIHDLGLGRWFWAYWPRQENWQELHPELQGVLETESKILITELKERFPDANELELGHETKQQLYRQIQRVKLPDEVRKKIAATLIMQRREQEEDYLAVGFVRDDLSCLKALKLRYRELARDAHPDHGGDPERFKELQILYERACQKLKAQSAKIR